MNTLQLFLGKTKNLNRWYRIVSGTSYDTATPLLLTVGTWYDIIAVISGMVVFAVM